MTGTTAAATSTGRAATTVLWVGVGTAWLLAWFVPWTSRGVLSTSSLEDGARLVRSGSLSGLVPTWVAWALLLGPVAGLVLVASSTRDGRTVAAVRYTLVAAMSVAFVLSWNAVASWTSTGSGRAAG